MLRKEENYMDKKNVKQKEYDIDNNTVFKTKFGTFDKDKPSVIYLNARAKLKPTIKKTNYAPDIKRIKNGFDKFVSEMLSKDKNFGDKFLFSCDVSENNLSFSKKSHIKYEVLVKPVERKNLIDYSETMSILSKDITEKLIEIMQENNFIVC